MKKRITLITILVLLCSMFVFKVSADWNGMDKGISYFNQGMYYEAIAEIQTYCDYNWYYMSAAEQNSAVWYLNNAKMNLGSYLVASGMNYYNSGLFYEAKNAFESALTYAAFLSAYDLQIANDYLYFSFDAIYALESSSTWESDSTCYEHSFSKYTGECEYCGELLWLYSGEGLDVYFCGINNDYGDFNLNLLIENYSDRYETVQVREESVNGYKADFIMSEDIPSMTWAVTDMTLKDYDFDNVGINSIEDIHTVDFKLIFCEDNYFLTPPITVYFY